MKILIIKKKISDEQYNYYINGKFYIGTVQKYYQDDWVAQLLWDEGGSYMKKCETIEQAHKQIEEWTVQR